MESVPLDAHNTVSDETLIEAGTSTRTSNHVRSDDVRTPLPVQEAPTTSGISSSSRKEVSRAAPPNKGEVPRMNKVIKADAPPPKEDRRSPADEAMSGHYAKPHSIAEPWDKLRDSRKDVLLHRDVYNEVASKTLVQHHGPNCATCSMARWIPVPGVLDAPEPLRSRIHPEGIPEVLHSLPPAKRRRVQDDTTMLDMAARDCLSAHRSGRKFSLEHPGNSVAKDLPSWVELCNEPGVLIVREHHCMYPPCSSRKYQMLITDMQAVADRLGRMCRSIDNVCDRTGIQHADTSPVVSEGKIINPVLMTCLSIQRIGSATVRLVVLTSGE